MEKKYRIPSYDTVVKETGANENATKVIVHSRVTAIEVDAFRGWKNLKEVVFEEGSRLERIGNYAFADTALRQFTAPDSLKRIGAGAFSNCKDLKQVGLNEGLEVIGGEGDGAFQNSGVETVHIPSTVQKMSEKTFSNCKSLKRVEAVEGHTKQVRCCVGPAVRIWPVPTTA